MKRISELVDDAIRRLMSRAASSTPCLVELAALFYCGRELRDFPTARPCGEMLAEYRVIAKQQAPAALVELLGRLAALENIVRGLEFAKKAGVALRLEGAG